MGKFLKGEITFRFLNNYVNYDNQVELENILRVTTVSNFATFVYMRRNSLSSADEYFYPNEHGRQFELNKQLISLI